jgi:hypothetical protein
MRWIIHTNFVEGNGKLKYGEDVDEVLEKLLNKYTKCSWALSYNAVNLFGTYNYTASLWDPWKEGEDGTWRSMTSTPNWGNADSGIASSISILKIE